MPGAGAGTGVFGGPSVVWPWPRQEEQMCKMSLNWVGSKWALEAVFIRPGFLIQ